MSGHHSLGEPPSKLERLPPGRRSHPTTALTVVDGTGCGMTLYDTAATAWVRVVVERRGRSGAIAGDLRIGVTIRRPPGHGKKPLKDNAKSDGPGGGPPGPRCCGAPAS